MLYSELKEIRQKLEVVEHALIPSEKLSASDVVIHKRDLTEALLGSRIRVDDI
jgi:uncharacterized protein YfkK (UPF0435 family)